MFMVDVNERAARELNGIPIGMFIFPVVIKFGDEHGENVCLATPMSNKC